MDFIIEPPDTQQLKEFYLLSVNVSGVLLGLLFTALIFVLEQGFNRLKYMRQTLNDLYLRNGLLLTLALSYSTIVPLLSVFGYKELAFWVFVLYWVMIFVAVFRFLRLSGEINTMFSSTFVPKERKGIRRFINYILNNQPVILVRYFLTLLLFSYPVIVGWEEIRNLGYSDVFIFPSVLIALLYAVFYIPLLVYEVFSIQKSFLETEYTQKDTEEDQPAWDNNKIKGESAIISKKLENKELLEVDYPEFVARTNIIIHKNGRLHLNINLENKQINSGEEYLLAIKKHAGKVFKQLLKAKIDVNQFNLSIHFNLGGKYRNTFISATREELKEITKFGIEDAEIVDKLKNILLDDLFAEIGNSSLQ